MAISLLVLLIVCSNVANLLLARSLGPPQGIQHPSGARRQPVAAQPATVTETLLLAAAGALAWACPLALWTGDALPWLLPKINVPVVAGFHMNGHILVFTLLTCVAVALVSGAAPALLWFRMDANEALKEGGRGGSQGSYSLRLRGLLVVSEVALATLALVGAGLFFRSFENARKISPGFDTSQS